MEINNNLCRLCMFDKELVWIFDQRFGSSEKNMKNVVMVTTGVEVLENDIVSQYICTNCCKLTLKMFDFRERAVKTDQYLKLQNQCQGLRLGSKITLKYPNTSGSITMDSIPMKPITVPSTCNKSVVGESTVIKTKETEVQKQPRINIHPSIQQIFSKYADIKVSTGCLKFDVNPVVSMQMNCVEEYFKRKNLDMKKHVHKVLRTMRASKKTSALHPSKNNHENDNKIDKNKHVNDRVSPINVNKRNSEDDIDSEDVNDRVSPININKRNLEDDIDSEDYIINKTMKVKRRRLSSSDFTTSPEKIQPTLMEILPPEPENKCNLTQVNTKALKKHYRQHFICPYCKSKFRVLERRTKHVETCAFKHALTCPTYVDLETLDLTQYRSKNEKDTEKDDVIELSDDEYNTISLDNSTPQVPIPKLIPLIQQQSIPYISTAVVKPSIKFIDTHVLNGIDISSPNVFKELLIQTGSLNKKLVVNNETQTTLPTNNQIVHDTLYATAKLKNLLSQLYVYKVPIEIKHGKFNVSHTKNKKYEKKRVIDHWARTKIIDVTGQNSTNLNVDLNRRLVEGISLFATPTNNSFQEVDETCNVQSQNLPLSGICQSSNVPQQVPTSSVHMHNMPVLTSNLQMQNMSQTKQALTSNLQMHNMPQTKQALTSNLHMQNMPQANQALTNNLQMQNMPQKKQALTNNFQMQDMSQTKQALTNNLQMQNMPQKKLALNNYCQMQNMPQTKQALTNNLQMQNMPQTKKALTSNLQVENMPQSKQASTDNLQMKNMPQTKQASANNLQMQNMHRTKKASTNNLQMQNMPQTKQALTSNLQVQNMPQTKQASTDNLQMKNIPQTKQASTNNLQMQNMHRTKKASTNNLQMQNMHRTKKASTHNLQMQNMSQTKQASTKNLQMQNMPQTKQASTNNLQMQNMHRTKKASTNNLQMQNMPQTKQASTNNLQMQNMPRTKKASTNNFQMQNMPQTKQASTNNLQMQNMPQTKQASTNNLQMQNMPQTKQASTNNLQMQNMPRTKKASTNNLQMQNMPQTKQASTNNLQMQNMPQTKQASTNNLQMQNMPRTKKTSTNNLQLQNMPQTKQVLTSNVPKHFLPNMGQSSNGQIHLFPESVYTGNVQSQNMPHHVIIRKLPQKVQTNPPVQNTNQGSLVPNNGNSLSNIYFCQPNRNNLNANSQKIVNNTNNNTQGFVNISTSILSTKQPQKSPLPNYNIPANNSVLINRSMSNLISTSTNSLINAIQLPSSASKTPPPNINYFSSTNLVANTNTNFNNSIGQNIHKPQIRVRNLCELK